MAKQKKIAKRTSSKAAPAPVPIAQKRDGIRKRSHSKTPVDKDQVKAQRTAQGRDAARKVWRSRIVAHSKENPADLLAHPDNWRLHPSNQQDALNGGIDEIGFIRSVTVSKRTGRVLDGHLRVTLALRDEQALIDVEWVDLSEAEELKALLTLDPIGALAVTDEAKVNEAMVQINIESAELDRMVRDLAPVDAGAIEDPLKTQQVYIESQIIDAAFKHYRSAGFPYRKLPRHVSMQEINKLAETDLDALANCSTAYHVADTYHPQRFHGNAHGNAHGKKSVFDGFMSDKLLRRALHNTLEAGGTIGDGLFSGLALVSGVQPLSNFRPGFALLMYKRFCKRSDYVVLDTSTGYGGRLVGFIASGLRRYIGIDPNTVTHKGNVTMSRDLGVAERVKLINKPAEDVTVKDIGERCDFAFTSPPYFSKERYSDEPTQSWKRYATGEAWRDGFLIPAMRLQYAALKRDRYAVLNIADVKIGTKVYPLVEWARSAGKQVGFDLVEEINLRLTRNFGQGLEDSAFVNEPALVFHKR